MNSISDNKSKNFHLRQQCNELNSRQQLIELNLRQLRVWFIFDVFYNKSKYYVNLSTSTICRQEIETLNLESAR